MKNIGIISLLFGIISLLTYGMPISEFLYQIMWTGIIATWVLK